MPETLIAWAAVAPDGTIDMGSLAKDQEAATRGMTPVWDRKDGLSKATAIMRAYRAGWRVVRVRIEPVEDGK